MKKRRTSFLEQRIPLLGQPFKLFSLLRDPVRVASLIPGAGESSGLFNQLPDVVTNDRDAFFEFRERKRPTVAHDVFPRSMTDRPNQPAQPHSFDLNVRRMDDLAPFGRILAQ